MDTMGVRRVVPDLVSKSVAVSTAFYSDVLGLQLVMDHGWIVTLADPASAGCPDQPDDPRRDGTGHSGCLCSGG